MKILIAGGPRVGKTTLGLQLAQETGYRMRSTDSLIATEKWSDASAITCGWLSEHGPWIIEGVAVFRALRKWLAKNPTGAPADVLYIRKSPRTELTPGQRAMAKGCDTVWREISGEVFSRGTKIMEF